MRALTKHEVQVIHGGGILGWVVPVAVGFIFGGPPGVVAVVGTYVATQGVNNLEYLATHRNTPSIPDAFGV
jgi:hypothetical protein